MNYRTGIGFDVHAFIKGRKLILGGIDIPFEKGLAGHSDADANPFSKGISIPPSINFLPFLKAWTSKPIPVL